MKNVLQILSVIFLAIKNGQLPRLGAWTYFLLALLVAIEGPIATFIGAAAASSGMMKIGWVYLAASIGNLCADTLWYLLGYLGKIDRVLRFGHRIGVSKDVLDQLQEEMRGNAAKVLFIAKLTISFVIPSLITAGLMKIPWKRWFPAIFLGEVIWTGGLLLVGFYTTEAIKKFEKGFEYLALGGGLIFISILFILIRNTLRKNNLNITPTGK